MCPQCAPVPTTVTLTIPRAGDTDPETDRTSTLLGLFQASSVPWQNGKPVDPSATSEVPAWASSPASIYNSQPVGTQSGNLASIYNSEPAATHSGSSQDPVRSSSFASTYSNKPAPTQPSVPTNPASSTASISTSNDRLGSMQSASLEAPARSSVSGSTYSSNSLASMQPTVPAGPPPLVSASGSSYSISIDPTTTRSSPGSVDPPSQSPASSSSSLTPLGSAAATPALFTGAAMIVDPANFLTGLGLLMVSVFF